MKKKLLLFWLFTFIFCYQSFAISFSIDPVKEKVKATPRKENAKPQVVSSAAFRNFEELEAFDKKEIPLEDDQQITEGFTFTSDSIREKQWLNKANAVFAEIEKSQNFIEYLTPDDLGQLPIGIPKNIGNIKYTVGIAKAVLKPAYAELTVFLQIEIPQRGTLILGAADIKLSHAGGIVGDAKLNLISRFTFNINEGKAFVSLNGSLEDPGTYALIDCSGFKELGIDADLSFSKGLLHPVDEKGKEKGGLVSGHFKTVVSDWNDVVINISLPQFGVKGLKGTTFNLNNAVFDFSDLRNDASTPPWYLSKYYGENPLLWRGVYVSSLKVVLPEEFKKKGKSERMSFEAANLIIDGQGITGKFIGENLISIDEGSAAKWKFSLDYFEIDIETNNLKAGAFNGELVLPVSKLDRLEYTAIIQPDEYVLAVSSKNNIEFDVWSAKVVLTPESYIEMKVSEGSFRPKAVLHGSVNIASGLNKGEPAPDSPSISPPPDAQQNEDKTVNFKGIKFENLVLQTESPKFSVSYFGYSGEMKIAGFPLTINELALETVGNKANLIFDFDVSLTGESDGGNGGGARLIIISSLDESGGTDKWKFEKINLERIYIAMEVAGMELQGAIFIFEDNPTYGTGFAGAVSAKFTSGLKIEVEAKALFGKTETFRYWFADASVTIPSGIPIFTGFALNSFGGGAYQHMRMAGVSNDPDAAFKEIGTSSSGVIYEPYGQNGLGMKASVGIITQNSESVFHASVEFGMAFLNTGGLQEIYFKGHGELLTVLPADFFDGLNGRLGKIAEGATDALAQEDKSKLGAPGAMTVDVFIGFDFVNDTFHSTADIYINFGILNGVGARGRAGWMDLYVAPDEWHILIGTPDDPVGISLNLAILKIETRSYFMAGDNLPGSPPPPPQVSQILGLDASDLDYTRDLNALEAGRGLAFGAHVSVKTGDLTFLIFYASFDAGVGFDVMIRDYGDAHCKGSSGPVGLNGWYANGQAYAYLQGELGLKFKLFGFRRKIPIIRGGGAVILQARLPNPVWFQGYLGGSYNLLGGLIKGKFRFKVELGEKCEMVGGSALDGIVVIGDLTPKDNSTEVDVFTAPQAVFNMPVNKVFDIPDETGDRQYKIVLDKFEVTENGKKINGEIKWNNGNDVAIFYSHEILPPKVKLKASLQVSFEEKIDGAWKPIMSDGKKSVESKEVSFTTGEAPTTIPFHNIEYVYPVVDQKNFYVSEYPKGYIHLLRGQSYLFDIPKGWKQELIIQDERGTELKTNFSYDAGNKQVNFNLPTLNLQTAYSLGIVSKPSENALDANVKETYNRRDVGDEGGQTSGNFEGQEGIDVSRSETDIKSRTAEGLVTNGEEHILITYDFRTSRYQTFSKKMKDMNVNNDLYQYLTYPYGLALLSKIDNIEPFEIAELTGNSFTADTPLVKVVASLDDDYYKKDIAPLIYKDYPIAGSIKVRRETEKVSVPPVEGVEPMSWYLTNLENDVTHNLEVYNPYRYNLSHYYEQDFFDLRYQMVSENLPPAVISRYINLITAKFPLMKKGTYKSQLQYVLPGQVKKSDTNTFKYMNPLYE